MTVAAPGGGRDAGVVLIEVLAALSIVAVMSGLMVGFLGQLQAVGSLQAAIAARSELAAAADHLQRVLAAARAAPLGGDGGEAGVFDGTASEMRFVAVTRRGFRSLALREVRIAAAPVGGRPALVESLAARRPQAEAAAPPVQVVVLEGLAGVRFEYAGEGGGFADGWQGGALPAVVRITLSRTVRGRPISVQALARTR
jgi:type II secretory pathway pseudopilin PulG